MVQELILSYKEEGKEAWFRDILLYRDNGRENGNYHIILGLYYIREMQVCMCTDFLTPLVDGYLDAISQAEGQPTGIGPNSPTDRCSASTSSSSLAS